LEDLTVAYAHFLNGRSGQNGVVITQLVYKIKKYGFIISDREYNWIFIYIRIVVFAYFLGNYFPITIYSHSDFTINLKQFGLK
jgi:hypothetical protein